MRFCSLIETFDLFVCKPDIRTHSKQKQTRTRNATTQISLVDNTQAIARPRQGTGEANSIQTDGDDDAWAGSAIDTAAHDWTKAAESEVMSCWTAWYLISGQTRYETMVDRQNLLRRMLRPPTDRFAVASSVSLLLCPLHGSPTLTVFEGSFAPALLTRR